MLRHAGLERAVRLVLEHTETWQLGGWPIPLVERRKVEAFVLSESLIGDNLRGEVQVLLFTLTLLRLHLQTFLIKTSLCRIC